MKFRRVKFSASEGSEGTNVLLEPPDELLHPFYGPQKLLDHLHQPGRRPIQDLVDLVIFCFDIFQGDPVAQEFDGVAETFCLFLGCSTDLLRRGNPAR